MTRYSRPDVQPIYRDVAPLLARMAQEAGNPDPNDRYLWVREIVDLLAAQDEVTL